MRRSVTALIAAGYAIVMMAVTLLPMRMNPAAYWGGVPWWAAVHYVPFVVDAASFVLNIVMFVPFGVLVPVLWARVDAFTRVTGWAVAVSAGIELVQLVLGVTTGSRRTVDVNDLIANAAGAAVGWAWLRLAVPHREHRETIARPVGRRRGAGDLPSR